MISRHVQRARRDLYGTFTSVQLISFCSLACFVHTIVLGRPTPKQNQHALQQCLPNDGLSCLVNVSIRLVTRGERRRHSFEFPGAACRRKDTWLTQCAFFARCQRWFIECIFFFLPAWCKINAADVFQGFGGCNIYVRHACACKPRIHFFF